MNFQSQVAHALDEEHRVNLDLLGKVEQALARMPRTGASQDPELTRMAAGFARHVSKKRRSAVSRSSAIITAASR